MIARLLLVIALLSALYAGEQYVESIGYDRRSAEVSEALEKQREEVAALRGKLLTERAANADALAKLIKQMESERGKNQNAVADDVARRRSGPSLRYVTKDPGQCGRSSASPETGTPGAAADTSPAIVQLPRQINDDLLGLLGEAESLKVDYSVLYRYVHNPKLVCELQP